MRVLVADPIADEGIRLLREAGHQVDVKTGQAPAALQAAIADYDALVVRSETQVTEAILGAGKRLQVVGRAGVGIDNIDVNAATRHGILVINAPTANIIAAAEHTLALLLSMARHVPQAHHKLRAGYWGRKEFTGTQLRGKTLGIIGLGKVGTEVAKRARAFEMRILANDPFVSEERAKSMGIELADKDTVLSQSDFISVHVPMNSVTKGLIGKEELTKVKPGVRFLNTARGGVIDEQALYDAVQSGRVAGAAIDVFSEEPAKDSILFKSDKIIVTPHLGASTNEAQELVAIELAEQLLEVFKGRPAKYAVNAPVVVPEALAILAPFVDVGMLLGRIATQIAQGQVNSITIRYEGEIAKHDSLFLKAAIVGGLLSPVSEERVNAVNVNHIVGQRGMKVNEEKGSESGAYRNLLAVELHTSQGKTTVAGTSAFGHTHIVQVNDYRMDVRISNGYMLFIENQDRPGMIGAIGTIAGKADVNISFMEVGRLSSRGRAIMAIGLDEPMPDAALKQILAIPGILSARLVKA